MEPISKPFASAGGLAAWVARAWQLRHRELAQLPPRVGAQIRAEDDRSERIIGWVQLALVTLFAALYAVARRPVDAGMAPLAPVPLALAAYAIFTAGRLALAHRGRLPTWLIALSIVVDLVLLFGLIWVFHMQYGQPPAFSLKVPTFAYVFVFIVLRCLRFDPRYVLMAGLAAAIGWIGLTLLAIATSDPGTVTRNFVAYLSGNAVLVGAELDKVIAILLVTLILALGMRRAQRTLVTAIRDGAAVREVSRFLSDGVAEAVATAESMVEAGEAVARDAAIVMLDLRGFTRHAERMEPEDVVRMLTAFHALVVPIVRDNGGVIDKFLGDGVMATFGAVRASSSSAADAMRAFDEIMARAAMWQAPGTGLESGDRLVVNGALAAGRVVFAAIGNHQRLEYTVIGDAVNTAAKLEKHNKTARTRAIVTAAALAQAKVQGYVSPAAWRLQAGERINGIEAPLDIAVLAHG